MRRRLSRQLIVAVAAISWIAAACATGVASAASPTAGGFSVRPLETNPANPLTLSYFVLHMGRGSKITRHVSIVNSSSQPLELLVYPVDGLTGSTSGDVYANRGVRSVGAGQWLRGLSRTITVPADDKFVAPFTVAVPKNATPGDHLAGVAVEAVHKTTSGGRFSITEVFREVVGVELIVKGPASRRVALTGATLHALPGTNYPSLVVKLADSGRLLCQPRLTVSLRRPGTAGSTVSHQLGTVLPGNLIAYPFPWPHALAAGTYSTTVRATGCGRVTTLRTTTRLVSPLKRTLASSVSVVGSAARSSGPSVILVGLLVLAFAGGGLAIGVFVTRRAHRPPPAV